MKENNALYIIALKVLIAYELLIPQILFTFVLNLRQNVKTKENSRIMKTYYGWFLEYTFNSNKNKLMVRCKFSDKIIHL